MDKTVSGKIPKKIYSRYLDYTKTQDVSTMSSKSLSKKSSSVNDISTCQSEPSSSGCAKSVKPTKSAKTSPQLLKALNSGNTSNEQSSSGSAKSVKPTKNAKTCTAQPLHVPNPGKTSKTSTPTKDISLFSSDISCVPSGAESEVIDESYEALLVEHNIGLLFQTSRFLLKREKEKFCEIADQQLTILKTLTEEGASALSDVNSLIDAEVCFRDFEESVELLESYLIGLASRPVFADSKPFEDITAKLEQAQYKLPCKNIVVPKTKEDFDNIEIAGKNLCDKLNIITAEHQEKLALAAHVKEEILSIKNNCDEIVETIKSLRELMPAVTNQVIDEATDNLTKFNISSFTDKF